MRRCAPMTMVWIGAAVAAAFVLLLVVRAVSAGSSGDETAESRPPVAPHGTRVGAVASIPTALPTALATPTVPRRRRAVGSGARPPTSVGPTSVAPTSVGRSAVAPTSLAEEEVDEDPSGPRALILVQGVGRTDRGRRRSRNEDAYLVLPDHSLFVIADGMGGHAAGEVASRLAVDVIAEAYRTHRSAGTPRRGGELVRAIERANAAILKQARANLAQHGMGTTIVAARFSPNRQRVYICHVGDSRAYRVRDGRIDLLTVDHTLGAAGITGPAASKLSRAVGAADTVEVDLTIDSPRPGDHYMLCCDGLNKMVGDDQIRDVIVGDADLDRAANHLIDVANDLGGRDNITVILIRVDEPTALSPEASARRHEGTA